MTSTESDGYRSMPTCSVYVVLGMKSRTLTMLGKHLPTELPPQSWEIQILKGLLISGRIVKGRTWFEEGVSF